MINERLKEQLEAARARVKELEEEHRAEVSGIRTMAAEARWNGHDKLELTNIRCSLVVAKRVQSELPRYERRQFVDDAITTALDSRSSESPSNPDKIQSR